MEGWKNIFIAGRFKEGLELRGVASPGLDRGFIADDTRIGDHRSFQVSKSERPHRGVLCNKDTWGYIGIIEKNMETTMVYWVILGL